MICYMVMCLFFSFTLQAMPANMWHIICEHEVQGEKELAIVVPMYNNSSWCIKNITSILSQNYDNYHVYLIDDCSTDNTYELLYEFLSNHPLNYKVSLRRNNIRLGVMANWYNAISGLADHVIVLNIDGDDWPASDNVFMRINQIYTDKRVWMTFGQFRVWPDGYKGFCKRPTPEVIRKNSYRKSAWVSSHMRTYYAWLFKKVNVHDFKYEGTFFSAACDRAIMYPLLEMCAGHYYCFEDEILYIYNVKNPFSMIRTKLAIQQKMSKYIRSLPAYKPLADVIVAL